MRRTFRHGDIALFIVDDVLHLPAPDGSPIVTTGTTTNVIRHEP